MHIDVCITLIFVGKKAGRDSVGKKETRHAKDRKQHDYDDGFLDQYCAPTHITLCGSLKYAVKPLKESPQESVARRPGLEQQCRKRGAERERIECGKQNGNRDRDGKLLVKLAGDSGNEGGGHKYGGEN